MPKFRILSGNDVLAILVGFGFQAVSQKGSHIKIARILQDGYRQVLTIPLHDELDNGTVHALYRQSCRFVPEEKLHGYFYSE